ncbi:MAG: hypothetical protein Q8K60_02445 [Parachlamydiaceae bacterium]|nr:hypothetical protein [Parachlamydiaceae bacterium]
MKKKAIFSILLSNLFVFSSFAITQENETLSDLEEPVVCTKEELINFFPKQVVKHVLIKAKIPEEKADQIAEELSQKNLEIINIAEGKSSKIDRGVNMHNEINKIYDETLFEIFKKVLSANGINDLKQDKALMEQIKINRSKLFTECIKRREAPEHSPY